MAVFLWKESPLPQSGMQEVRNHIFNIIFTIHRPFLQGKYLSAVNIPQLLPPHHHFTEYFQKSNFIKDGLSIFVKPFLI